MRKYQVLNRSKQTVLASNVELAETAWTRMKGLLGRKASEFDSGKGLWIVPSQGVHTIGMSFPIDVIYLDSERRVIRVYHRLAPFRIAAVKIKARSVIELPAGTLAETRTEPGDVLEITELAT
ncbi:MAG TPA: DUF192 domain-containing protein [Blastocatellia bacterium]|nr:DUF192 domain-containing protein [Blastocatellia bacterium]